MNLRNFFSFIIIFFSACFTPSYAAIGQLFTSDNDLSCSLINDIFFDNNGFLWVATEDGLNRGDGAKFIVFKNDAKDEYSIASNFVSCVFQDKNKNLLIGSYAGVQLYNPHQNNFSKTACLQDGKTPYRGTVRSILQLRNGEILTIGDDVMSVKIGKDKNITLTPYPVPKGVTEPNAALEDSYGNLWFACDMKGVYCANKQKGNKTHHYFGNGDDTKVETFFLGTNQNIFAGTATKGIYKYDKKSDSFVQMFPNTPYANIHVKSFLTIEKGKALVSTDGQGLYVLDYINNTISADNTIFPDNAKLKIHKTIKDEWGNTWLAIYQKGVAMLQHQSYGFQAMRQNTHPYNKLIGTSCITSILRSSDEALWVSTDNDGLYELSPDLKSSKHYTNVPSTIMMLFEDSKDNLWIGSYGNGTGILNKKTGIYKKILLTNNKGVYGKNVFNFVEDGKHNIWIATMGGGLFTYTNSGEVVYDEKINSHLNQWITSVVYSPARNNLYVGTYNGVYKIYLNTHKVEHMYDKLIVNKLLGNPEKHTLWVATATGLTKLCKDKSQNKTYTTEDGLPSNTIYGIETNNKALWLSTNHGLSRFNIKTETFTNFFVEDGLQSNEFYKNASCSDNTGTLYFGGINGLTYFNPMDIGVSNNNLNVRLTDFYVRGESVRDGLKSGGKYVTDAPIYEANEFNLCYDDNSFSVEFTTRQPISSSQLNYFYSFDDEGWKAIPQQKVKHLMQGGNILNFTNVASGYHTLLIKVACGETESPELELSIYVAPPFYASWWAQCIYLLILLAIVYYFYRRTQEKAAQKRQELINKHEAEINESKLRFFTNISHEIRTPLSLVISPLEKLMYTDHDSYRQRSYKTMYRNATRILKLVNELMDLRKIDNGRMQLKFSKTPIVELLHELYATFEQAAAQKNITFTFNHNGCDNLSIWVDPSNFDKIIINLLSNAFKFTDNNGHIDISLTQGSDSNANGVLANYAEISVTDTGIGIPEQARKHIFDRFYQVNNNNFGGTGIGLHLSSRLVQLHHGTITVEDNPSQTGGTRFIVRVPLGNDHLTAEELAPLSTNSNTENDIYQTRHSTNDEDINQSLLTAKTLMEDTSDEQPIKPKKNKLVYLVEDDKDIQNYLASNLGEYYKVRCFQNGEEALKAILKECPDLVITDVMMPKMDGYTLTHKIRQNININHVPIIILTAKTRDEEQLEGLEQGADAYMTKPFNINILQQTADNLIKLRQQLRNVYNGNQTRENAIEKLNVVSNDEKLMEKIMQVVNKNISNPDLTIEVLAKEVGISRVHLHRKLKELTNQSSSHFIRNIRLKQAAEILREKDLNISEICYMVGFKHPNNFSVVFKEMYGISPTAYAEEHRKNSQTPNNS